MAGSGKGEGYHHWFERAEPEEQGSFCNLQEGRYTEGAREHVNNTDSFTAEVASRTAESNGGRSFSWSDDSDDVDSRFNHLIMEKGNNLVADDDFYQATYAPGK